MNARQFDVFHDGGHKGIRPVGDGVRFGLYGVFQEFVDQYGTLRRDAHSGRHVTLEHFLVMNHFHAASAEDVRGSDHERVADLLGDLEGFVHGARHS